MELSALEKIAACAWRLPPTGGMRVPGMIYASEELLQGMDSKVLEQLRNMASLPGIVDHAYAMPDAHWGYGFPIGGVGAFDPREDGIVSAGGVGFDIACGVRTLSTTVSPAEIRRNATRLADALFNAIPAGVGSRGSLHLEGEAMAAMLRGGARWAVDQGYGDPADLERIEQNGMIADADPAAVSKEALRRQADETGTLGSGNHYLEVQVISEILDEASATLFGLQRDQVMISIHCGSRGLGHQVATDYAKRMVTEAARSGLVLADRELACAPLRSATGEAYLGAMRSAANCALANRQALTHLVRRTWRSLFGESPVALFYDVSHNLCSREDHAVDGKNKTLFVHRKGATRALGPGHPSLPAALRPAGQPVLVGGSMGTASWILAGRGQAFASACHGAGRSMSRSEALRRFRGGDIVKRLAHHDIIIRSPSLRGIAEEAPDAYKDVDAVIRATAEAGLAIPVARLTPLLCIKG